MRSLALALLLVTGLAAWGASDARAQADQTHRQTTFMGDRAFGMGGAATGLAADTSGAFYNPAALAELPNRSFSASLGLNAFARTRVRDGVRGPSTVADLDLRESRTLPVFSAALLRFGAEDEEGMKRHAIALSTLHPASDRTSLRVTLLNESLGIPSVASVESAFSQTYYGLSYALRLRPDFALGITAFLAVQRFSHRETLLATDGGAPGPVDPMAFVGVDTFAGLTTLKARSFSILPRIGVFYRPHPRWSLGLSFQPPAILLRERGNLNQESVTNLFDPATGETETFVTVVNEGGAIVRMPIPWMVRAGVGVHPTDNLTLGADIVVHGAVPGGRALRGVDASAIDETFFFADERGRRLTVDFSIGAEWVVHDGVTLRAGAFSNRSSALHVPMSSEGYAHPQVHQYGGALGVGMHVGGYHFTFGIAGTRGRGDALTVDADPLSPTFYARTQLETRVLYIFVSGATRSMARLARSALRRIRDSHDERHRDEER